VIDVGCTALTIRQPLATLIATGLKRSHTLRWPTQYRGTIAIHADRASSESGIDFLTVGLRMEGLEDEAIRVESEVYPLGAVIALADLTACYQITTDMVEKTSVVERCLGDHRPGMYAWRFSNVRPLEFPYPARGQEGLWQLEVPL
jgi:activating signal cointegrator 1